METLFTPFVTTKPSGLGLGLAICRSIIQSVDGRLWAENNADRGTTFRFSLPIQDAGADDGRDKGKSQEPEIAAS